MTSRLQLYKFKEFMSCTIYVLVDERFAVPTEVNGRYISGSPILAYFGYDEDSGEQLGMTANQDDMIDIIRKLRGE